MTPSGGPRPGLCSVCKAPLPHPPVHCPICLDRQFQHIGGVYMHLCRFHQLTTRGQSSAMDVARAEARGWPIDYPRQVFEDLLRTGVA